MAQNFADDPLSLVTFCVAALLLLDIFIVIVYFVFRSKKASRRTYNRNSSYYPASPTDPNDITSYPSTKDIVESGKFTANDRRREYIRRGKSPSGVIDGEYNDTFLENGDVYNDTNRDWDADT